MTYNQIKNVAIPPAKRTAKTVQKWVAKLPSLPVWPYVAAVITKEAILANLTAILVTGLFCPLIPITYGALMAGILVFLSAYTLYESRNLLAEAIVMILASL